MKYKDSASVIDTLNGKHSGTNSSIPSEQTGMYVGTSIVGICFYHTPKFAIPSTLRSYPMQRQMVNTPVQKLPCGNGGLLIQHRWLMFRPWIVTM